MKVLRDAAGEACRVKCYVAVELYYTEEGEVIPLKIEWEDGRIFTVDAFSKPYPAASKTGAQGLLYPVRIGKTKTRLFYEDPAWFVEKIVKV